MKKKCFLAGVGGMLGEAFYFEFSKDYELYCTDKDVNEIESKKDKIITDKAATDSMRTKLNKLDINTNPLSDALAKAKVQNTTNCQKLVDNSQSILEMIRILRNQWDYELSNGLTMVVPELRLLVDPQTSGGLLAAVPEQNVTRCLDRLSSQGYTCACIGRIEDENWSIH
mgnify:CR=1 FL=1